MAGPGHTGYSVLCAGSAGRFGRWQSHWPSRRAACLVDLSVGLPSKRGFAFPRQVHAEREGMTGKDPFAETVHPMIADASTNRSKCVVAS